MTQPSYIHVCKPVGGYGRSLATWIIALALAFPAVSVRAKRVEERPATHAASSESGLVIVNVREARGNGRFVYCGLFDSEERWPAKETSGVRGKVRKSGSAQCVFRHVPPGDYAIAVFHDANGNRKLDTNWVGVPQEGWATSRNVKTTWGAPPWNKAKFTVVAGRRVQLTANLNY